MSGGEIEGGWTPAPIRIEPQGDGARGYWLHDDNGDYVAMVCKRNNRAEEEGNAALYSVAPALCQALKQIAGDRADATGCNPQLMRDTARKALALITDEMLQFVDSHARVTEAVTPAADSPKPDTHRSWEITWDYGFYTATSPDYEASYEGEEDGWVANGQRVTARTREDLIIEIDAWFDEAGK